jgi:hypothetical protein
MTPSEHTPAFKAKVALAAVKGDELGPACGVARRLPINAEKLFGQPASPQTSHDAVIFHT